MKKNNQAAAKIAIERLIEDSSICEQWMTREVYTLAPTDTVTHARELLVRYHINQLPVVSSGKLLGIVTDRDLRTAPDATRSAGSSKGKRVFKREAEITVDRIMSHPPIALSNHSTLVNAASVMRQQRIGSVPIVSGNSLQGILTRSDILDAFVAYASGRYNRRQRS